MIHFLPLDPLAPIQPAKTVDSPRQFLQIVAKPRWVVRKTEAPKLTRVAEHTDLRWDDAIQLVLDATQLSRVRDEKDKAKKKSGDFTSDSDDEAPQ